MIYVDLKCRTPLYEQLVANIKELIHKGLLEPNAKLPSVRELAATLTINPNTIQKAYRILETEGYIYVIRGRGNFVATLDQSLIDTQCHLLFEELEKLVIKAVNLKIGKQDLIQIIDMHYKGGGTKND